MGKGDARGASEMIGSDDGAVVFTSSATFRKRLGITSAISQETKEGKKLTSYSGAGGKL